MMSSLHAARPTPRATAGRQAALERAARHYDGGAFLGELARLVAVPTESEKPRGAPYLAFYLTEHMRPMLEKMGFVCEVLVNPALGGPTLLAERVEDPDLPSVLIYGHGDVVRGLEGEWSDGLGPWRLVERMGRIYGRGVADNKGQHLISLAALRSVLVERGRLGFNAKFLLETGGEIGSPGLREICSRHRDRLAADLLLASAGTRLEPGRPTLYLGSRGVLDLDLVVDLRERGQHAGNWGGLLANPAVLLAHAVATIISANGAIRVPALRPRAIAPALRRRLGETPLVPVIGEPAIDAHWGEPGLAPVEKLLGWNSFEVLAWSAGSPRNPLNVIPPRASAHCQIRYTVDSDPSGFLPAIRQTLDEAGLQAVQVRTTDRPPMPATRTEPDHHWVTFARRSVERTSGAAPAILPNLGGLLPNDCFTDLLGLPTVWVAHAHRGSGQHAANEHVLPELLREGMQIMAGLFWDLGETSGPAAG
ncbi:MAG TPA: M20/M25/M40 family metallo-hydrolase [Geminicoccaceae bacterium]|nr:M20/M25/M40 family metallo-hydrolase [Geminicoccaceae bacterium]